MTISTPPKERSVEEIAARKRERDIYIAIMVAAARGRGLRLTWEECADLAADDAVATRAANGLSEGEFKAGDLHYLGSGWERINPYRAPNLVGYQGASRDDQGRLS